MLRFPKDFVWGSSTSGPQTEGRVAGDGKGDNLWDYWYSRLVYKIRVIIKLWHIVLILNNEH